MLEGKSVAKVSQTVYAVQICKILTPQKSDMIRII